MRVPLGRYHTGYLLPVIECISIIRVDTLNYWFSIILLPDNSYFKFPTILVPESKCKAHTIIVSSTKLEVLRHTMTWRTKLHMMIVCDSTSNFGSKFL